MAVQVLSVDYHPGFGSKLHGFELNEPTAGASVNGNNIRITGWALAKRGMVRRIQVMHGETPWKSASVCHAPEVNTASLPDVPQAAACGFLSGVGTVGLPPQFKIDVLAVLHTGQEVLCATITGKRDPIRPVYRPKLNPLIVTSLARTGTTHLMQTLNMHDEVVLQNSYPFEARPACYWLHMMKVFAEPSDGRNTFQADLQSVPPCPVNKESGDHPTPIERWFGSDYVVRCAEFAQQNCDAIYEQIGSIENHGPAATYFAEKSLPCHIQWIAQELYPMGKEIILVRDFRDMICSMIAFNKKRGYATFGREHVESDADFIRQKRHDAIKLLDVLSARSERALCVRYENLVLDPRNAIREILEYLSIKCDDETIRSVMKDQSAAPNLNFHRTTNDESSSVGRWKRDLPPKLQALCGDVFGDLLTEAGYDF